MYRAIGLLLCCTFLFMANSAGQTADKELSLKDAVEAAIKNNPAIKKARHEVDAAKGRYLSGISLPSPVLSLTYEEIPLRNRFKYAGEKYLEVSQSFDFPVSYVLKRRSLSGRVDLASSSLESAAVDISSQVKKAYYNALAAQAKLKLSEENLKIAEDFALKAAVRLKAGEAVPLEEMTARVEKARASSSLEIKRNNAADAFNELNLIMGTAESEIRYRLTDTLGYTGISASKEDLLSTAFSSNPLIRSAELSRNAASAELSMQWWNVFPSFELSYSRQTIEGNSSYYGFSLGVSVPLWFMFKERGQIQEASAGLSIAEAEEQSIRNEIAAQLNSRYLNFLNSRERIELYLKNIVPQAEEIFRTAKLSYETGEATYLEFLQASQTLVSTREEYIDALLDYNLALVALGEITGSSFDFNNK